MTISNYIERRHDSHVILVYFLDISILIRSLRTISDIFTYRNPKHSCRKISNSLISMYNLSGKIRYEGQKQGN